MTNYFRHYKLRILTSCNCYTVSTTNEDNKLCVIKDGLSFIRTDDSTHFAAKARIILNACLLCIYLLLTLCWRLCLVSMVSLRCSAHYCSLPLAAMLPNSVSAVDQDRMLRVTLVTIYYPLIVSDCICECGCWLLLWSELTAELPLASQVWLDPRITHHQRAAIRRSWSKYCREVLYSDTCPQLVCTVSGLYME